MAPTRLSQTLFWFLLIQTYVRFFLHLWTEWIRFVRRLLLAKPLSWRTRRRLTRRTSTTSCPALVRPFALSPIWRAEDGLLSSTSRRRRRLMVRRNTLGAKGSASCWYYYRRSDFRSSSRSSLFIYFSLRKLNKKLYWWAKEVIQFTHETYTQSRMNRS